MPFTGGSSRLNRQPDLFGTRDAAKQSSPSTKGAPVPSVEYPEIADPAEEVLVRVQPSFVQLGAVPLVEDPIHDPRWRDE